jgi:Domain of unknown function (DUF4382)/Putative Ig domain
MKKVLMILAVFSLISVFFTGCSSKEAETGTPIITTAPANEVGVLEVWAADAPASVSVDHIWVSIENLEAHQPGGSWTVIDANPPVFDLKLIEGNEQVLTSQTLLTGEYTQIRFGISSVAVQIGPQKYDAVVPSDEIRLVQTFNVVAGKTTDVVIDFIASESLLLNGKGEYIFKPVIHLFVPESGVLGIVTPSLDNGQVGEEYRAGLRPQLQAFGGKKPYRWNVSVGSLPPGLSLNSESGVISGTPTLEGIYTFEIQVTDSSVPAQTDSESFTIRITSELSVTIVDTSLPNGELGEPYDATIDGIFGTTPYTFTISDGSLPDGLSLAGFNSQGSATIFGTPTKRGNYTFSIKVTDSSSPPQTDIQTFNLLIK